MKETEVSHSRLSQTEGNADGTQLLRKAAAILRLIGQSNAQGVGLAAIRETLRLPRSTTHRILKCLVEEGLVRHEPDKRRYCVGRLTYELGLAVTTDALEVAHWRVAVDRVAQRTGITSFLISRSGIEATCILKAEGTAVIRAVPIDVGQRRFLGVGAGSTALLAALDNDTTEHIIMTIAPLLSAYPGLNAAVIRGNVEDARTSGFAVSRSNVVKDVLGIGMAIPKADGIPDLALSVATVVSQANDQKIAEWKQIMRREVDSVLQTLTRV